ncbi:MAG TPA: multiheme c-type cytochrome [Blastocatellia bacterium]|nr:multiheme c-type cytochrome [Blastocatellia bacterium]
MGGLARRVSYIKAFQNRSKFEVPTLFVDAGNLFTDDRFETGQLPADALTKNKWVVKAYGDFRHAAANISFADLPYLAELFKKDGFDKRAQEYPFLNKLISANIQPQNDTLRAPAPYVIREITLKRSAPGKKLRIGIVGFTEPKPSMEGGGFLESYAGFRVEDPAAAAKRILPELKQKADIIVALAYMPQIKAQLLATENPEIDTVIGARQVNNQNEVQHFNRATITYAYNQTKFLGELRYYLKGDGTIENQINRFVGLDSFIPDDPGAQATVTAAHTEFTNLQTTGAQQQTSANLPLTSALSTGNSEYVGAQACAVCHQEEYEIWEKSGHAHAMATLEGKNQQFDNECVGCHVVAFQKEGGFQSLVTTPQLANVQCEACHGPGRKHIESPAKGFGFMEVPTGCVQCHTQPNSPDFDFAVYWPQIAH